MILSHQVSRAGGRENVSSAREVTCVTPVPRREMKVPCSSQANRNLRKKKRVTGEIEEINVKVLLAGWLAGSGDGCSCPSDLWVASHV